MQSACRIRPGELRFASARADRQVGAPDLPGSGIGAGPSACMQRLPGKATSANYESAGAADGKKPTNARHLDRTRTSYSVGHRTHLMRGWKGTYWVGRWAEAVRQEYRRGSWRPTRKHRADWQPEFCSFPKPATDGGCGLRLRTTSLHANAIEPGPTEGLSRMS